MRSLARRSAAIVSGSQRRAAAAISAGGMRRLAGVSFSRSKRWVSSMSAASPREATSAMIAATAASTSAAPSPPAAARAVSLSGTGHLGEGWEPVVDLLRARLQRGAVEDEAGGHVGNALDLDEAVRLQGRAGLHQIDDVAAKAKRRRQLHRAVELDAL